MKNEVNRAFMAKKKYIFIALALTLALVGCRKKVNLKAEWENLEANAELAFGEAQTMDEQQAVLTNLIDSAYLLLKKNIKSEYADTLFLNIYPFFSAEQKEELFDIMPESMLEQEQIKEIYDHFLIQSATSKGHPYIDFTGLTPEGEALSLSELVGQTDYVLVDFWASWCGPCRRLIPVLQEIYAGQPKGRLQILSCSVDQREADWIKAMEEEQMPWPQIRETEYYPCSEKYGVQYIPHTVLIDRNGIIVGVNLEEPEIEEILLGE